MYQSKYKTVNCLNCNKEFESDLRNFRRRKTCKNQGMFCCLRCSAQHQGKQKILSRINNVSCSYCQKKFHMNSSEMKNSKSGLFFCCRKHKDLAQKISFGLKEIHPSHYGGVDPKRYYRERIFEIKEPKCDCGFNFNGLLVIHHVDKNRKNNKNDNFEILCPICHNIRHMHSIKNIWRYDSHKITPRSMIPEIEKLVFGKIIHTEWAHSDNGSTGALQAFGGSSILPGSTIFETK